MDVQFIGWILISTNIATVLILLLVKWKEIAVMIMPDAFCEVTMVELDNNCKTWLQWKGKNLTFNFNEGVYNMFTSSNEDIQNFRNGSTKKFFYFEGYENPVNIKKPDFKASTKLRNEMLKVDFAKILTRGSGIMQLLNDNLVWIVLGGFIVLIFMINKISSGAS